MPDKEDWLSKSQDASTKHQLKAVYTYTFLKLFNVTNFYVIMSCMHIKSEVICGRSSKTIIVISFYITKTWHFNNQADCLINRSTSTKAEIFK